MKSIELAGKLFSKKDERNYEKMVDNTLFIDCRECPQVPELRSPNCVKCIVGSISRCGNAENIRLRTSRDTEISGRAVEILCQLAAIDRSSRPLSEEKDHKCKECVYSCKNIFGIAWEGFPDPYFESARTKLLEYKTSNSKCDTCLQKTYRALDQAELGLTNIKKQVMGRAPGNINGGV